MNDTKSYAPTLLRIIIGPLFIITGLQKLFNPSWIIGLLNGLNFPAATFLGWVLLLSELIFGIAVLVGWRAHYAVWPLAFILLIATLFVHLPGFFSGQPMAIVTILFHLFGIAANYYYLLHI